MFREPFGDRLGSILVVGGGRMVGQTIGRTGGRTDKQGKWWAGGQADGLARAHSKDGMAWHRANLLYTFGLTDIRTISW